MEMRKRALSVLSAEKDHMQISFISENKPLFENASFVYNFFMIAACLKEVLHGLKCP